MAGILRSRSLIAVSASLALIALSVAPGARGDSDSPKDPPGLQLIDSVPSPASVRSGEVIDPDILIAPGRKAQVEAYRVGGRIVAVKITPTDRNAAPYYLIDTDGDGRLDSRRFELESHLLVNAWELLTWE